ncbi:unnamed protein product [Lathyrus sativus]|nr:unnamed protein product [Lathyrus sativus]
MLCKPKEKPAIACPALASLFENNTRQNSTIQKRKEKQGFSLIYGLNEGLKREGKWVSSCFMVQFVAVLLLWVMKVLRKILVNEDGEKGRSEGSLKV